MTDRLHDLIHAVKDLNNAHKEYKRNYALIDRLLKVILNILDEMAKDGNN